MEYKDYYRILGVSKKACHGDSTTITQSLIKS